MSLRNHIRPLLVLLILHFFFLGGCGGKEVYKRSELLMGTVVEISVADEGKSADEIEGAIEKAFRELKRIEKLLSAYDEDSEISRLNRSGEGEFITVSDETFDVIKKAIELSELSDGAFDITVAPILELWGFSASPKARSLVCPKDGEIKAKLSLVGSDKIIIDDENKTVGFSVPGMKLDLGGIAKGYAVDKAIEVLKNERITGAMVNAGGDIYCLGAKVKGKPWVIAIKHPREPNQILTRLKMKDRAIATSGDYEKYFVVEGKRYCHIIDPRSGYPVQNGVMSVTILAPTCLEADALATAVFVLGREEGLKLIDSLDDVEGMVISQDRAELRRDISRELVGSKKF